MNEYERINHIIGCYSNIYFSPSHIIILIQPASLTIFRLLCSTCCIIQITGLALWSPACIKICHESWPKLSGSAGCTWGRLNQKCTGKIQILVFFNVNNLFIKFFVKNIMINILRVRWINKYVLKAWKVLLL